MIIGSTDFYWEKGQVLFWAFHCVLILIYYINKFLIPQA